MATKLTHLHVVPRTDTATLLPQDLVEETALYFVAEGFKPEDIPLISRNRRARAQVMGAMRRIRAS